MNTFFKEHKDGFYSIILDGVEYYAGNDMNEAFILFVKIRNLNFVKMQQRPDGLYVAYSPENIYHRDPVVREKQWVKELSYRSLVTKKQSMTYTIKLSKNKNWFLHTGDDHYIYLGTDENTAIMVRDILNSTQKIVNRIYANSTGVYYQNENMKHPSALIKWALPVRLPSWPDNESPFNPLLESLMNTPTMLVTPPDNKTRQQVWTETYLASLKDGGSIICASADADAQLSKFDNLFTKKTTL